MIWRALDRLTDSFVLIAGVSLAIMAVHIVCDVGGRYIFNSPLPGTVEFVARYYMIALVFLPLADVQRNNAHFVAGMFTDHLSERSKQILEGVIMLFMAAGVTLLAYTAYTAAIHATDADEQVQASHFVIYTWPARWLVMAGFALIVIYSLHSGVQLLAGRRPSSGSPSNE